MCWCVFFICFCFLGSLTMSSPTFRTQSLLHHQVFYIGHSTGKGNLVTYNWFTLRKHFLMVLKILFKSFKRMKYWSTSCTGTLKYKPIYNKMVFRESGSFSLWFLLHHNICSSVTQCKSVWPTNSEAKLYQNVGFWSSERFIAEAGKEMDVSCPKPRTP